MARCGCGMLSSEPRGFRTTGLPNHGASETPEIWYTKWTEPQRDRVLGTSERPRETPTDPGSRDSADPEEPGPEEPGEASAVRLPPRAQRRRGDCAADRTG